MKTGAIGHGNCQVAPGSLATSIDLTEGMAALVGVQRSYVLKTQQLLF